MPNFEFIGGDPIDHFTAGHIEPGDVVEFETDPGPGWRKAGRKRPTRDADAADTTGADTGSADSEEG